MRIAAPTCRLGFVLAGLTAAGPVNADNDADLPVRRSLLDAPAASVRAPLSLSETQESTPPPPYGVADTSFLTLGLRTARDLDSNQDTSLYAQYTYFLADDVEIGVEGGAWLILQGDDTVAVSFSIIGRYHFYQQPNYSVFVDTALGAMLSADTVPDSGTGFNLMPRVGIGMTWKVHESGARLVYGLHWHHISNARLGGALDNPARDGVGVYASLAIPW
ncbi:MAG: acyloxyacyl hydrolase [Phycisphaerales bacterium]